MKQYTKFNSAFIHEHSSKNNIFIAFFKIYFLFFSMRSKNDVFSTEDLIFPTDAGDAETVSESLDRSAKSEREIIFYFLL